ncbi:MAG: hypothetical protein EBS55_14390 [Flavobacteriaceae bacterium]|nr:hypothetical protein [Flavobacteriaceae bacterium]
MANYKIVSNECNVLPIPLKGGELVQDRFTSKIYLVGVSEIGDVNYLINLESGRFVHISYLDYNSMVLVGSNLSIVLSNGNLRSESI